MKRVIGFESEIENKGVHSLGFDVICSEMGAWKIHARRERERERLTFLNSKLRERANIGTSG